MLSHDLLDMGTEFGICGLMSHEKEQGHSKAYFVQQVKLLDTDCVDLVKNIDGGDVYSDRIQQ